MRVAVLANARHPVAAPFKGGLESFTWHFATSLRRAGVHVTLLAPEGSDHRLATEFAPFPTLELSRRARTDSSMTTEEQVRDNYVNLWAMQQLERRDDLDVVHSHSLHALPVTMAGMLSVPLVTTLHTPPTPWLEPALRLFPDAPSVAVSSAVASWWSHVTSARVIHNGVDLDQWPFGDGGPDLVWHGRITAEKSPELAIRIARAARRDLRIAGPVSDAAYYREHLLPLLGDGVSYVGHLAPSALAELLASSAVALVTPTWDEPFGLVAVEAMACGTPVVAVARGGLAEVVAPPGGIPVAPGAPDVVAAAADAVRLASGMDRRQVRTYVGQHFDIHQTIARHLELYEELR